MSTEPNKHSVQELLNDLYEIDNTTIAYQKQLLKNWHSEVQNQLPEIERLTGLKPELVLVMAKNHHTEKMPWYEAIFLFYAFLQDRAAQQANELKLYETIGESTLNDDPVTLFQHRNNTVTLDVATDTATYECETSEWAWRLFEALQHVKNVYIDYSSREK